MKTIPYEVRGASLFIVVSGDKCEIKLIDLASVTKLEDEAARDDGFLKGLTNLKKIFTKLGKKPAKKENKDKEQQEEDLKYIFYFYRPHLVEQLWKLDLEEGDDTNEKRKVCTQVEAAGQYCYAVIGDQKEVYAWGFGENYVLGNRDDKNEFEPKLLDQRMFEENPVVMMACGTQHSVALALESPDAKMPELSLP